MNGLAITSVVLIMVGLTLVLAAYKNKIDEVWQIVASGGA